MAKRVREAASSWVLQGYGSPPVVYAFYALKVGLYVFGWMFACSFTPGLGAPSELAQWWSEPIAFQKAILWSLGFEVLGLGCGSGPLTGRYLPPVGGALHFLRPGTTKLPLLDGWPLVGGTRRSWLDVTLYAALLFALGHALSRAQLLTLDFAWVVGLLALVGALDKTVFLAARAEHYWTTCVCFLFASAWLPGAKWVMLALWFWAGVSKLNRHFPYVVSVMVSNGPLTGWSALRRAMVREFPRDLRPSGLAQLMAHAGALMEFAVPTLVVLANLGVGGEPVWVAGLVAMLLLHAYIGANVPMGVPLEWNVMMAYGGLFLFGAHHETGLAVEDPALMLVLFVMLLGLPLVGNLFPRGVSFLLSMRYYAGNWPFSVWLFRNESHRKLDAGLVKSAPWFSDQLGHFYEEPVIDTIRGKMIAFRLMHLHGRTLQELVPRAVDDIEDYEWLDGELVAGMVLGWNFGDGHLHGPALLQRIQSQCGFEAGELRVIQVESQPLFGRRIAFRIHDAATGELEHGHVAIADLLERQPWAPESTSEASEARDHGVGSGPLA